MAQNLGNFDEALKIDYLPVVRTQLNNTRILSSLDNRGILHFLHTTTLDTPEL